MDLQSIDQVIQSTRKSAEYSGRNHSNSDLSTPDNANMSKPYGTSASKSSAINSRHLPSSRSSQPPSISTTSSTTTDRNGRSRNGTGSFADLFSNDVFQMVLRNPQTSHRLLKFCEKRACGESMEFLSQVNSYNRLLDDLTKTMSNIQKTFIGPNAQRGIDIPSQDSRAIQSSIKHSVNNVVPSLSCIFLDAQEHIENALLQDIYPRFVKHQITTSATMALGAEGNRNYQGLGDCFCLTDPTKADNPIVFASDGFVDVTGYSRREIVPKNCRFLQGPLTDRFSVKRLSSAIDSEKETVELLLNYRKNGEPFWNLLYVSPLYDHNNKLAFFLGGQINCSTTIHNYTDIVRILSLPEDGDDNTCERHSNELHHVISGSSTAKKARSMFFKSWTGWAEGSESKNVKVLDEPGIEGHMTEKFRRMEIRLEGQIEAFYTAYSKYLVLRISPETNDLLITFYSSSMIEFLVLPQVEYKAQQSNTLSRNAAPASFSLFYRDIFKILADQPLSANIGKTFKSTVRDAIRNGKAVSVEMGLMTGIEEGKKCGRPTSKRVEETYISHWTVLKDEKGKGQWVVLSIAPKES